jgi:ABC-type thiamine transport system ATPase subunit
MALIAVLVFSGVVVWVLGTALLDIVLLFAFQQSFPRFVSICVLGLSGAGVSILLKLWLGNL